jgi:hypothetical protein
MLKQLLRRRFNELKREREAALRRGSGGADPGGHWLDEIVRDKLGQRKAVLANLILFLANHPAWAGVLGYDAFAARVVIPQQPPLGRETPDTAWTDQHDAQVRVWFQRQEINATHGDCGRAVQTAARANTYHPVRD